MKRGATKKVFVLFLGLSIAPITYGIEPDGQTGTFWLPLAQDELHDPANPALNLLQNPEKALSQLPHAGAGDQVNWVQALKDKNIKPSLTLHSNTQTEILDLDVLLRNTDEMNMVNFPHKQHTEWLSCSNCHEEIFKSRSGTNKFGMFDILNGESCGRCHGAVAFPLTECNRCHSVPRTLTAAPAAVN